MSVPSLKHQKSKHVRVIFSNKLSSDILLNTVAQAAHQLCVPTPVLFNGVTEKRRLFRFYFMKEMKGWQSEAGGLMEGHSLADDLARAALAGIITHSLSATQPHSFTLCLLSFLPHSPFILDLLSWWRQRWWWVSLHDTELGVSNTIQNWDRFSTLHRSPQRITPFVKSAVLRAHFALQVCLVPLFGAT